MSLIREFMYKNFDTSLEQIEDSAWVDKIVKNYILVDTDTTESFSRLKEIPASRKKRFVILKWLVNQFEESVNYSEAEVNQILKRFHPDCATLRRELVSYNLMQRERGIYWVVT